MQTALALHVALHDIHLSHLCVAFPHSILINILCFSNIIQHMNRQYGIFTQSFIMTSSTLIFVTVPKHASPLRKVSAVHDLPSLVNPTRVSNPPSYPWTRPPAGERIPNESSLPLISPLSPQVTYDSHSVDSINSWLSNLPESSHHDMFHIPEKHGSVPSTPAGSPSSWTSTPRRRSWWLRPRKFGFMAGLCLLILSLNYLLPLHNHHRVRLSRTSM